MHPHSRRTALVLALTLAAAGVPGTGASQESDGQRRPAFTSSVDLVLHSVAVLDASGQPVRGLGQEDFRIYEDGAAQEISLFLAPDTTPVDIALVLDSSTSLFHWSKIIRRAGRTFLTRLDVGDRTLLLPFNDVVREGVWGLAGDPRLGHRIDGIFMEGGTALYDALWTALDGLAARVDAERRRRQAIVLLTDGADRDSQRRFDEVLDAARAAAVPIFPVVLGEARTDGQLRSILDALAGSTGGSIIESVGPEALIDAYDDVVVLLRASYLLGYRAPAGESEAGARREVAVRSLRPSYRLVHRDLYVR